MAQLFHRNANMLVRVLVLGGILVAGGLGWSFYQLYHSNYISRVDEFRDQPVAFSHKHHVAGL